MSTMSADDVGRVRHMLATLAYRGGKVLREAPPGFGDFAAPGGRNTPLALVAHLADLLEWAERWCDGDEEAYRVTPPSDWTGEVDRWFAALASLDARLASGRDVRAPFDRFFQAPIADALTHIGQLALLRRMAGAPVLGEAYRKAPIATGRVGPHQEPPGKEFAHDKGAVWNPRSRP